LTNTNAAIKAVNLTKRFKDLVAVDSLSLEVAPGEIFGIVGPDGSGKTTTLRMLSSILEPESGDAWIAGFNVKSEYNSVKDNTAYMSQRYGLYSDLTVEENLHFYADLYGVPYKERPEKIDNLLGFSNMKPFKKRLSGKLSGGMKQKLQLCCALIHTPKVLLLDEPTNGVDPVSRRDFWRILYQLLARNVAILVTTAYLDEAERCARIGLLSNGRMIAQGTPTEIKSLFSSGLLSIRSDASRRIRKTIESSYDRKKLHIFGDVLHILTDDAESDSQKISTFLKRENIQFEEIKKIPPSLEDVFISIMEKEWNQTEVQPESDHQDISWNIDKSKLDHVSVEVKNLTRRFGNFVAVDNVTFNVKRGEIFGFLGPNGAGKSTVIRMLCGLLMPSDGDGFVHGFNIRREAEKIKQKIGYMSQKFSLYEDLTVEENMNFYGGIYGLDGRDLKIRKDWVSDVAGISTFRHSMISILSSGWKQRTAFACSVLHRPPVVFMDEPTSGVDPVSRRKFWDLIYQMSDEGVTVFITTHYMEEAEYCDRLGMIYHGKLIAMGTPSELKSQMTHSRILNITCQNPQLIMDDIAKLPVINDIALFGVGLHAVVTDVESAISAVEREFKDKGMKLDKIEKIPPAMEDVFISLIEEVDRQKVSVET
jgi:ABC-2 type transport system ATP-binding protein